MHLLPSEEMWTPEIEGHIGVSGLYCCWGSGDIQTQPLSRTMLGSIVLPWLGSVQKSGSCSATKGHRGARLGLQPFPPVQTGPLPRARMFTGPKLHPKAMSRSVVQLQQGSVWISVVCVTSVGLRNHVRLNQRSLLSWPHMSLALGKLAFPLAGHYSKRVGPYHSP